VLLGGWALRRNGRTTEVFPFAPAIIVNEGLHAAPFGDFAFEPHKVDRLENF